MLLCVCVYAGGGGGQGSQCPRIIRQARDCRGHHTTFQSGDRAAHYRVLTPVNEARWGSRQQYTDARSVRLSSAFRFTAVAQGRKQVVNDESGTQRNADVSPLTSPFSHVAFGPLYFWPIFISAHGRRQRTTAPNTLSSYFHPSPLSAPCAPQLDSVILNPARSSVNMTKGLRESWSREA